MPMTLTKRGDTYHLDTTLSERRVRCSLGVRDPKAAERLANRVQFALSDGPKSEVWSSLKQVLPRSSFSALTSGMELPKDPSLLEFETKFKDGLTRRVILGELAQRTRDLYVGTAEKFFGWLHENSVRKMDDVDRTCVERYLIYRKEGSPKGKPLAESSMQTEVSVLKVIFRYAVEEKLVAVSPLAGIRDSRSPVLPVPKPFTDEEIARLDELEKTAEDDLVYSLFRFTGLRCSDVSALTWDAIDWQGKSLKWRTKKRGRTVVVPLVPRLYEILEKKRSESYGDRILSMGKGSVYQIIKRLGRAAQVQDCHPHKFRTHFICELLGKGASIYDVAAMVGDNVNTIQVYYAAITDKQQERIRGIMEAA